MKKTQSLPVKWVLLCIAYLLRPILASHDAKLAAMRDELDAMRSLMRTTMKATGRADGFEGGNWAVLVSRKKTGDQAHFFRLGNRNPAAVIDMLYRFEKAGADARLAQPVNKEIT